MGTRQSSFSLRLGFLARSFTSENGSKVLWMQVLDRFASRIRGKRPMKPTGFGMKERTKGQGGVLPPDPIRGLVFFMGPPAAGFPMAMRASRSFMFLKSSRFSADPSG